MKNTVGFQSLNYHTDILLDFKEKSGERIFSVYWKCVHNADVIMNQSANLAVIKHVIVISTSFSYTLVHGLLVG